MSVDASTLATLERLGSWAALYVTAFYAWSVDSSMCHLCVLYMLRAVISSTELQTAPILAELMSLHEGYRKEVNSMLEHGKILAFECCIPYVCLFTVLHLEAVLPRFERVSSVTEAERLYTGISQQLSFVAAVFTAAQAHFQDRDGAKTLSRDALIDSAAKLSNLLLYVSEHLLRGSCVQYVAGSKTRGPNSMCRDRISLGTDDTVSPTEKKPCETKSCTECDFTFSESNTQSQSLGSLSLTTQYEQVFSLASSLREIIFDVLRSVQCEVPLNLQLVEFMFWKPGQSFGEAVKGAKHIYQQLQTLTALSFSQVGASHGNFISPEDLQYKADEITLYYSTDQLVAARLTCLRVLQLLQVAPMQPSRPIEIKRLQRLFLSAFRIIQAYEAQRTTAKPKTGISATSFLAYITCIQETPSLQSGDRLLSSFYCSVMDYYCSTPNRDLYDLIFTAQQDTPPPESRDIIASVHEYRAVLIKTVTTCVERLGVNTWTDGATGHWCGDVITHLAKCISALRGLLVCCACQCNPLAALISITASTISIVCYYCDIHPSICSISTTFTQMQLLRALKTNMQVLIHDLLVLCAKLLKLEHPTALLETTHFQDRVLITMIEKMQKRSRSDVQFLAQKAISRTADFVAHLGDPTIVPDFRFASLAQSVSFSLLQDPSNTSVYIDLQSVCIYLLSNSPVYLSDYLETACIVQKLQADFLQQNNGNLLVLASNTLIGSIEMDSSISMWLNLADDVHQRLETCYLELLLVLTVGCDDITS